MITIFINDFSASCILYQILDRRISPILKLGFLIAFSGFLYFNELLDTDFVIFHTRIFEYLYLEWKYVFLWNHFFINVQWIFYNSCNWYLSIPECIYVQGIWFYGYWFFKFLKKARELTESLKFTINLNPTVKHLLIITWNGKI